jgi:modification methylase
MMGKGMALEFAPLDCVITTASAYKPSERSDGAADAPSLPTVDNTSDGLRSLQSANRYYRESFWPPPFDTTAHQLHLGDARDLSWIPDDSVHLIVTSPPYWTLKKYLDREGQLGEVVEYEAFLDELDKVWRHCTRVLVEGGRVVALSATFAFPASAMGATESCRCTQISKYEHKASPWIA